MFRNDDESPLLPGPATARTYGVIPPVDEEQPDQELHNSDSNLIYHSKKKVFDSLGSSKREAAAGKKHAQSPNTTRDKKSGKARFLYYIIYALVNVIISAPGLYGYAAVIFNHPVFEGHMNALSKLVIFSSFIHQLGFFFFSSLDFAIGTVQDAGLIFLSSMVRICCRLKVTSMFMMLCFHSLCKKLFFRQVKSQMRC